MNIRINKFAAVIASVFALAACNENELDLLQPKLYFAEIETPIEVGDTEDALELSLVSRVSSALDADVNVTYEFAGAEAVEHYNKTRGTAYLPFDTGFAEMSKTNSTIKSNSVLSEPIKVNVSNLSALESGNSYLLAVRLQSSSAPVIEGEDLMFFVLNKPVKIRKAFNFNNNYVYVPLPQDKEYTSVTYEALVYITRFGQNNTVMGREGTLIFRIGDEGGGLDRHILQIAGSKQYQIQEDAKLKEKQWYHLAFTYDQPSGKTYIYINGEKKAESTWDTPSFRLGGDMNGGGGFYLGKVAGFMWGERPLEGYMSEARMWSVARTEKQINQNMLNVDPASEGLVFYYKLNGEDQVYENNEWIVKDISGNDYHGKVNGGAYIINIKDLDEPIKIN